MDGPRTVLVIDDDAQLCEMLASYLTRDGFCVDCTHSGEWGLRQLQTRRYDLIILDVALGGMNGIEVLRQLRQQWITPVIMLTARSDDIDRIVGLEVGADDYLAKPFNSRELVARMRAVLRRVVPNGDAPNSNEDMLVVGDLSIDPRSRTVNLAGTVVDTTSAEFDVLTLLVQSAGRVVSRNAIAKQGLGRSMSLYDRNIDMHISKLRRKLGSGPDGQSRIRTIRNAGYLYGVPRSR